MFVSGLWHGAGYGFIVWGLFTVSILRSIMRGAFLRPGCGEIGGAMSV